MKRFVRALSLVFIAATAGAKPSVPVSVLDQIREDFKTGHAVEGAALLQQEASKGDPKAQYGMGILFEKGLPEAKIPQDDAQAFYWYHAAAQNGHAPSQNNVGFFYYTGRGVKKDDAQAIQWYEKAALQGDAM